MVIRYIPDSDGYVAYRNGVVAYSDWPWEAAQKLEWIERHPEGWKERLMTELQIRRPAASL